jgi:hypothetical protein
VSTSFTSANCPQCFRPLVVSFTDRRPAGEVVQNLYGCDVEDLRRFFRPDEWLTKFELPLQLIWGTAADWEAIAQIWRATRAKCEPRLMSLEEISQAWEEGGTG